MRVIAIVLLILAIAGLSFSANTCQLINTPGTYTLTGNVSGTANIPGNNGNSCIVINSTSNVNFNCNGFTINSVRSGLYSAQVEIDGSTNVVLQNCLMNLSSAQFGVFFFNTSNSIIRNNSIYGQNISSLSEGFIMPFFEVSGNDTFINNTVSGTNMGFNLGESLYNSLIANNTVMNTQDTPSAFNDDPFDLYVQSSTVSGNKVLNCTSGLSTNLFLIIGGNNNITGNLVKNNSITGYSYLMEGTGNRIFGNNATNNSNGGFFLDFNSIQTNVYNNTANGNLGPGFFLDAAVQTNLSNNIAYNNTDGFDVAGYCDGESGDCFSSTFSNLTNNLATNNINAGFYVLLGENNALQNNNASGNGYGFVISTSNDTVISGMHLYNNSLDFTVNNTFDTGVAPYAGSSNYSMYNSIFDNPAGSMANYTNLSINDTVAFTDAYTINWTSNSSSLPAGSVSFAQKFVNISTQNGTPSISSIVWSWTDAESAGHTETNFGLWKYNSSGWTNLNSTPSTVADTLSISNMNPGSIYGILENVTINCPVISSSGSYVQTSNFIGSPNNVGGELACLGITASNVTYDCNGFSMTGNDSSVVFGVRILSANNVTLKNCIISNYSYGLYAYSTNNVKIINNSVSNSSFGPGFDFDTDANVSVINNSVINTFYGFALGGITNITLSGNYVSNSSQSGYSVGAVNYLLLTGNTAFNSLEAFSLGSPISNAIITNNSALGSQDGFFITPGNTNMTLTNNTAFNNTGQGFYLFPGANGTILINNTAYQNGGEGFYLNQVSNNNLINNTAYNNTDDGFYVINSINNSLINNTAQENQHDDLLVGAYDYSQCANKILNTTGSGGRPVLYENSTVNLNGVVTSEIEMCDANNSVIANAMVNGSSLIANNGFLIYYTNNANVSGTTSVGNAVGFTSSGATNIILANDTAYACNFAYNLGAGSGINLTNDTAYSSGDGFLLSSLPNTTFINDNSHNNSDAGILSYYSDNLTFINDTLYGNGNYGVLLYAPSEAMFSGEHIYNNSFQINDFGGSPISLNMTGVIFDNPSGSFQNYTNLSINDTLAVGDSYSINWTSNSSALPAGNISFRQKFVNISTVGGTPSIDSLVWSWTTSEASGFTQVALWKYNSSGWYQLNNTPNYNSRTLSLFNLVPGSIYGILGSQVLGCQLINAPGTYTLTGNVSGASPYSYAAYLDSGSACILINNTANVTFDCAGYTINATGNGSTPAQVAVQNSNNVTVKNCNLSLSNVAVGVVLAYAHNSTVRNNTIFGYNSGTAFYIFNNADDLGNNSVINSSASGTFDFINTQSAGNTYANNTAVNINGTAFFFTEQNSTAIGNTIINCSTGFTVEYYGNNNFTNNLISSVQGVGFDLLATSNGNLLTGNNITNGVGTGFDIETKSNMLMNNIVKNMSGTGFFVNDDYYDTTNITLSNNIACNNTDGFDIQGINVGDSFYVVNLNNITNNLAANNTVNGFYIQFGEDNTFLNNSATGNGYGFNISSSNDTFLLGTHFYNNSHDFVINNTYDQYDTYISTSNYTMINSIFDNPSGSMQNFTNLSINDTVPLTESYTINWTSNSSSLPSGGTSFAQTFVNISTISGAPNITSLVWSWTAAEASGYTPATFALWKYNSSGWTNQNSTPNTAADTLSLSNMNPGSIYGILESPPGCQVITAPGIYTLMGNVTGNDAYPYGTIGGTACILINNTANVTLDCAGYTMNSTGTSAYPTHIAIQNSTNVTVKNCRLDLSNVSFGVAIFNASNSMLRNNTAFGNNANTPYEFYDDGTAMNSSFINNSASGTFGFTQALGIFATYTNNSAVSLTGDAFEFDGQNSTFTSNTIINCSDPFPIDGVWGIFTNNVVINSGQGFYVEGQYNRMIGNNVTNSSGIGFTVLDGNYNTLQNDISDNNTAQGFYVFNALSNNLSNDIAYNDTVGFDIESDGVSMTILNTLTNDTATLNSGDGFYVTLADNNTFLNNNASNDGGYGFDISLSSGDIISNNRANNDIDTGIYLTYLCNNFTLSNNSVGSDVIGIHVNASTNMVLSGNGAYSDTWGIRLDDSNQTTISNNNASNNNVGILLYSSVNDTLNSNTADNNGMDAIEISSSSQDNLTSNHADGNAQYGINFQLSNQNIVYNNTANSNSISGMAITSSNSNAFSNNTADNNPDFGIILSSSNSNNLSNNVVNNNSITGISIGLSSQDTLSNNTVEYDVGGIEIDSSSQTTLSNNTAGSNSNAGLTIYDSSIIVQGQYFSNNSPDMSVANDASPYAINASSIIFSKASGGSYTNISFNDSVSTGETYMINWTTNSTSLPSGKVSFAQKFVNISTVSGTPSIDSIVWSWLNSELTGYNVSRFQLWKYNSSGWIDLNSTPNTNTLSLHNMNPASIYGILQDNDTTPPVVNLISPVPGYITNASAINFSFNTTDDVSTFMNCSMYIDGVLNQTNGSVSNGTTTVFPVSVIPDGIHLWNVTCKDQSGNLGASATRNFTVDTHVPVVSLNAPVSGALLNSSTVAFNFTAVDNVSATMICALFRDGTQVGSNATTKNNTPTLISVSTADGFHTWNVTCNDSANNTATSATRNFTVDTTAPVVTLNNPNNSTFFNVTTVNLNFTATDNLATSFTCSLILDGAANQSNASVSNNTLTNWQVTGLAQGAHTWITNCTDSASNSGISQTRNFTVDTTAPTVTLNNPANSTFFNVTTVNLNFTATDTFFTSMTCSLILDGAANQSNASVSNNTLTNWQVTGLTQGAHTWITNCTDSAGNQGISQTRNFTVATAAPVVQLTSPGDGSTVTTSDVQVSFTALSNVSVTMNCSLYLDGILNATNSSTANGVATSFDLSNVSDGTYNWSVSCVDLASNTGVSATQDFIVNTVIIHETPTPSPALPTLSINLNSNCTGNVVSVRSGDTEISGAAVMVDDAASLGTLSSGSSDNNGQMGFTGCGLNVRITVQKDGYQTAQINEQTVACGQCAQCTKDTDCPDSDSCAGQKCVPISCSCGQISGHTCNPYECCSDSDCASGTCQSHTCEIKPVNKTYECTSDDDCADNQYCDIPAGAQGGNCQNITGCGVVANHVFTAYQCGSGPNCPSCSGGQLCISNVCKSFDLKAPTSGFIGDSPKLQALEDNITCAGCDLVITDPTGKILTGKTDSAGNFVLPLQVTGNYHVAYMKNGTVVKSVDIQSLPRASTTEQTPPTLTIANITEGTLTVLIILVLIAAAIILMRRRKGGGSFKKKPKE